MKKTLLFLNVVMIAFCVEAQIYTGLDSIPGYYDKYYYTEWYEDCPRFHSDSANFLQNHYGYGTYLAIRENYTSHRIKVKGVAALVARIPRHGIGSILYYDTVRQPEYLKVYQWSDIAPDTLIFLDSVRWDTASPKMMCLPTIDPKYTQRDRVHFPTDTLYCYAYEAYFDNPVYVDSTFYLGGTHNSNVIGDVPGFFDGVYLHVPTEYFTIHQSYGQDCPLGYTKVYMRYDAWDYWGFVPFDDNPFGQFLAIVDIYNLEVESGGPGMGEVEGGGRYSEGVDIAIRAMPYAGYKFSHWSDGDTANPRVVRLTSDTVFTALFTEATRQYGVTLSSSNLAWGSVIGGGVYYEQQQVTIEAVPADGCRFVGWDDGVADSPRTITLTQDTAFTAYFTNDTVGIFSPEGGLAFKVAPNPAADRLAVTAAEGSYTVEVYNDKGECLIRQDFRGSKTEIDITLLAVGHYTLRLRNGSGYGVRGFVKQ